MSAQLGAEEYGRRIQNYLIVWIDQNVDGRRNAEYQNSMKDLRAIVHKLIAFNNIDQCIRYMNKLPDEQIFVISSGQMSNEIVPQLDQMTHVNCVYIFCAKPSSHEEWAKQWPKIQGIFIDIRQLCDKLNNDVKQCDRNTIPISFITTSNKHSDQINPSFIYAQVLKEILPKNDLTKEHKHELIKYFQDVFKDNQIQLNIIDKFKREYQSNNSISWYISHCFLSTMLNRALRTMKIDLIMILDFFIRDLQENIIKLHFEQYTGQNFKNSITVYRCQFLSKIDFEQLTKMQGELITFNSFLSASKNQNKFSNETKRNQNLVPVLFIINIDPSKSSIPFADISNAINHQTEEEILFSLPSIFHIEQIHENSSYVEVQLSLINDDNTQFSVLMEQVRLETFPNMDGWYRFGNTLMKFDQLKKAEEVFKTLNKKTSEPLELANIRHTLGTILRKKGKHEEAIQYYEQSINEKKKILSETHPDLLDSYTCLSQLHESMGNYGPALAHMKVVIDIQKRNLPPNHPNLAASHSAIGNILFKLTLYDKALFEYEQAHAIYQRTLPANHMQLAISCNNMGQAHVKILQFEKAIPLFEQAINIGEKSSMTNPQELEQWKKNLENLKTTF